ncbi:MAG TPA: xanthine dehydrogenase family protein molybdopterin-binding subunit [Pseudacidobacterium sp.]|jgi:xanthine dehydrogenase YagR molybdenum-binding subunit|nr:xanthine dehydrogenase family protein molybdopterin-binding subunit [Pseudacidobacterium sp.]
MSTSVIGAAVSRVDGKLKVTGAARYAVDHPLDGIAYGVGVPSTIANGKIARIDSSSVEKMPGVLAVLHHGNSDPLFRSANGIESNSRASESRPPFEDDVVYYYGQFVALVVANTFEQAQDAAVRIKVEYQEKKPTVHLADAPAPTGDPVRHYKRGDADSAFKSAPVQLDQTYRTPAETHNPMEMHATIAVWNGDKVTLYETTQGVVNHHHVMSEMLGMPLENVHIISPFCGSGFGGKLFPWPHSMLAAMAARRLNRPVKVSVPRTMMFTTVGHRPDTQQRIRIGATQDGKLVSLQHDVLSTTSFIDDYAENCTEPTPLLYSCANVTAQQHLVQLNIGTPTPMRGPGTTPGLFALESAMDELAIKLNLDPLEVRLRNYAENDESTNKPFSSKHLREAYQTGADRFGWSKRNPKVGSMRDGDLILGWGMGTCTWPAGRGSAEVRVRLNADGTARASSATQDIGTGTYTILAQVVSEKTGIPVDKIEVVLGDSSLTPGPMSGGSTATASVLPAVAGATNNVIDTLIQVAVKTPDSPFHNADPKTIRVNGGMLHGPGKLSGGVPFHEILAMRRLSGIDGQAKTSPDEGPKKLSSHTFGAQFCEITWDPGIARLRVSRWLTVMDAGRIINQKTARNQILGGVVMGIGMGLFEETLYDSRNGKPLNNNFADYIVSSNPDIPQLDCIFLDYPDLNLNEYGARGVGEIGLTGVASALTMAVYHATGIRVRNLPIRIEQLLA